jgi:two-component system cell cycle response regulator DivK
VCMAKGRILYIEDNPDNRLLIKRVLEAEGYAVIEAENGTEGLRLAANSRPDLVLMDINLPDIDGYECTTLLRETHPNHLPIVALTANALKGDRQRALDAGCDDYIAKPVDIDMLPAQIEANLKR